MLQGLHLRLRLRLHLQLLAANLIGIIKDSQHLGLINQSKYMRLLRHRPHRVMTMTTMTTTMMRKNQRKRMTTTPMTTFCPSTPAAVAHLRSVDIRGVQDLLHHHHLCAPFAVALMLQIDVQRDSIRLITSIRRPFALFLHWMFLSSQDRSSERRTSSG